jgi:predicted Rossmann-fold nucleotide-binding protein
LERVQAGEWMCEWFDKVFELSAKLTDWSMNSGIKLAEGRNTPGVTRYHEVVNEEARIEKASSEKEQSFLICTGGGPGFMEAANMGSASITDARSIGVREVMWGMSCCALL